MFIRLVNQFRQSNVPQCGCGTFAYRTFWGDAEGEAQVHIVYIRCGLGGCSRTCIYILVFDLESKLFLAAGFSRAKCGMALGETEYKGLFG